MYYNHYMYRFVTTKNGKLGFLLIQMTLMVNDVCPRMLCPALLLPSTPPTLNITLSRKLLKSLPLQLTPRWGILSMKGHAEKIQILIHYVMVCMNRFSFVISQKEAQGRKEVQDTFFSRCISPRGLKAAKTMCSRQCPTTFLYVMQVHAAIMPYTHLIEKFSDFFPSKDSIILGPY